MSSAGGALRAWSITGKAWRSLWQSFAAMPATYAGAFVFYVAIAVTIWKSEMQVVPAVSLSDFLLSRLLHWVAAAMQSIATVPLAVAVYRFVLRGETGGGVLIVERPAVKFWLWLILSQAVGEVAGLTVRLAHSPAAIGEIMIAIGLTLYLLLARLILVFPATAIDAPADGAFGRLRASWQRTRGHYWLIVRVELLTALPLVALFLLTSFAVMLVVLNSVPAALRTEGFITAQVWLGLAGRAIYGVASAAVVAASTAWIYRSVTTDEAVEKVFE